MRGTELSSHRGEQRPTTPKRRGRKGAFYLLTAGAVAAGAVALTLPKEVASEPRYRVLHQAHFREVPVVVVVFDEFPVVSLMDRHGAIDRHLYPSFAQLSGDATWYRNTATTGVFTKDALPSILTGMQGDDVGILEPHPQNLFTLLGDAYPIRTMHALPGFCAAPLCRSPRDVGNPLGSRLKAFSGGARGTSFGSFLDLVSKADPHKPAFFFNHSVMPHSPWRFLPSGQRYLEDNPEPGEIELPGPGRQWADNRWLVNQVWQRHLLQVGLVDRLLGELLDVMSRSGIYERSLLVVTADHGVAFEPGQPKRVITKDTLGHVAAVPLFVKLPFQRGGVVSDAPASLVDVLPTISDVLDLSETWPGVDGHSLRGPIASDRERVIDSFRLDPAGVEKWRVLRRKYQIFGAGSDSASPFIVGPLGSEVLLGRSIDDLGAWVRSPGAVRIVEEQRLEDAYPSLGLFPALIEGTADKARSIVAVAVNGRIVALTRTYRAEGRPQFYAMVDPEAFGSPPNSVEVFAVRRAFGGR